MQRTGDAEPISQPGSGCHVGLGELWNQAKPPTTHLQLFFQGLVGCYLLLFELVYHLIWDWFYHFL